MAAEHQTARLTDFAYDVLNNTMDAILRASMDQERQYLELREDALLSADEFIDKYRLREDLSAQLDPAVSDTERERILTMIYEERQQSLSRLLADGPPKLLVEEGTIRIKLAFSTGTAGHEQRATSPAPAWKIAPGREKPLVSAPHRRKATDLAALRIERIVRQRQLYRNEARTVNIKLPDPNATEPSSGSAYGEIEIKFSVT